MTSMKQFDQHNLFYIIILNETLHYNLKIEYCMGAGNSL